MRFLEIAMFLFLINVGILFINELGFFGYEVQAQSDWIGATDEIVEDDAYKSGSLESADLSYGIGDFGKALFLFVKSLLYAIVAPGYVLTVFGAPTGIAILFSIPVYLIYIIALIQVIRGFGFESAT